jgi:hypothetical protein
MNRVQFVIHWSGGSLHKLKYINIICNIKFWVNMYLITFDPKMKLIFAPFGITNNQFNYVSSFCHEINRK